MRQHTRNSPSLTSHFVTALFLFSALLLLVVIALIFLKHSVTDRPVQRVVTRVNNATLIKNYTAHYPVLGQPSVDATIRNYIEKEMRTFEQRTAKKKDIRNHFTTSFTMSQASRQVVSLTSASQERIVGQPNVAATKHFTFDLLEGRLLTLQDIIKPDPAAWSQLVKLLHDYFKQQTDLALTSAELVNILELSIADVPEFSTESEALILYLNPRQPTSPTGKVGVKIHKSLLSTVLIGKFNQAEADRFSVTKSNVEYYITEPPSAGDKVDPTAKMVALTFDDGPSHLTSQLLDALDKYEAHATFFVLGKMVPPHAALLQRMVREGNEIGNHSWGHPILPLLSDSEIMAQIDSAQTAIQAATGGYSPRLMRPPYGETNLAVSQALAARGLHEVLWSVDTFDWRDRDAQIIYDRIMGEADGQNVLLHDIHPASVEAAVRAIRDLKAQGFQLVTVSQLYQYR